MNSIVLKWISTKDLADAQITALTALLSSDEQARAARFRRCGDRKTYVAAHALLRVMLAERLGNSVSDLVFDMGAQGKPALPGSNLHFNLSHTTDLVLVGLCRGRDIGVDVEWLGRDLPLEIAPCVFTPSEQSWLEARHPDQRTQDFLRLWTLKEAVMKATGKGLTLAANSFEVATTPPAIVTRSLVHKWQLHDVPVPGGYVAALAVEGLADVTMDVARAGFQWLAQTKI